MMKRILAAMIALMTLAVMAGCKSAEPAVQKDPAEAVASVGKEFVEANADQLPALMEVDAETLEMLYGIKPEWVTAYDCRIPMMNVHATELFVAEVKDGNMDAVKAGIEKRLGDLELQWEHYLADQYELVKNAKVITSGNYILMCIGHDAAAAADAFTGALA